MTRPISPTPIRRVGCRLAAAVAVLVAAAPLHAQFASVPRPPALVQYDLDFGGDSVSAAVRATRDSTTRAEARADLRAWVDSAARARGVRVEIADSLRLPPDTTGDSTARARRDSLQRDSLRRARPALPPPTPAPSPRPAPSRAPLALLPAPRP